MKKFLLSATSLILVVGIMVIIANTLHNTVEVIWNQYPDNMPPRNGYYIVLNDLNEQILAVWVDTVWYQMQEEWSNEKYIIDVEYWTTIEEVAIPTLDSTGSIYNNLRQEN